MRYILYLGLILSILIACGSNTTQFQQSLLDARSKIQAVEPQHDMMAIIVRFQDQDFSKYSVILETNTVAENGSEQHLTWPYLMPNQGAWNFQSYPSQNTLFSNLHTPLEISQMKHEPVVLLETALQALGAEKPFDIDQYGGVVNLMFSPVTPLPDQLDMLPEDVWLVTGRYSPGNNRWNVWLDAETGEVLHVEQ